MEGVTLMERQDGGLVVELRLERGLPVLAVRESDGSHSRETEVPGDRALDAFYHPSLYVGGICNCSSCRP